MKNTPVGLRGLPVLACVLAAVALHQAGSSELPAPSKTPAPARSYDSERCKQAEALAKQPIPLPYDPTQSTEDIFLRVNGVRYAIPANFFRYPPIGCDAEETDFLLRVLLPDFEGYSADNREAMTRGGTARMHMNIHLNGRVQPDMKRTFSVFARDVDPNGAYPTWRGLYQAKNWYGHDVYFERQNGKILFLMVCKTKDQVSHPSCRQFFPYAGATVRQHFSRNRQENWREIRAGTIRLLDRFVRRAAESN